MNPDKIVREFLFKLFQGVVDEVFSTGNYAKVTPLIALEDRILQPGPIYDHARELYFDWAQTQTRTQTRA